MFRKQKLESLLSQLVAEHIKARLPYAGLTITITRLEVADDFKKALIFVTIYPEDKTKKIYNELQKESGRIRKTIGRKLTTKFIPLLEFRVDEGEKNRARIEELIKKWKKE